MVRDSRPIGGRSSNRPADRSGSVNSLLRGLAILDMFLTGQRVVTVTQLARQLGVHKSTASRLAATLELAGYLERVGESGRFRLGPKLASLGVVADIQLDLRKKARPVLDALVQATGETAHLGILDGRESVTIEFVDGLYTIRMATQVGKRSPAYCTALGKALLAGLAEEKVKALFSGATMPARTPNTITSLPALLRCLEVVRQRGYSTDNEELEPGLCCVGAPVFNRMGQVTAAVSISGPVSRFTPERLPQLARKVKAAAARISVQLGAPPQRAFWGDPPAADELDHSLFVAGQVQREVSTWQF